MIDIKSHETGMFDTQSSESMESIDKPSFGDKTPMNNKAKANHKEYKIHSVKDRQ